MKQKRRKVELVVISDVHLGTFGSQARELNRYLMGIKPKVLVLNGDIIDFWQFRKHYWPDPHMKVVKTVLNLAAKGTEVHYITGNHDETLRNKWLAKLGSTGYGVLVLLNVFLSFISRSLGLGKVSLSKKIKENVKSAVKYIGDFENTAARLAIKKGFQTIVVGHIHHPEIKEISMPKVGRIMYLNSGDWVENMSALEYNEGTWRLYRHVPEEPQENERSETQDISTDLTEMNDKEIFDRMVDEFNK
jgi:UDP-2,3-diacylglucosamine pyrophosphatase LpxH